jgi:hypothetical protein
MAPPAAPVSMAQCTLRFPDADAGATQVGDAEPGVIHAYVVRLLHMVRW